MSQRMSQGVLLHRIGAFFSVGVVCAFASWLMTGTAFAKPPARGVVKTHQPVKARVWYLPPDVPDPAGAKWKFYDVTIVGRDRVDLVFAADATGTLPPRLPLASVVGVDFAIEYDRYEVMQAMTKNNWALAITLLNKAYAPYAPYLDLPNNNALDGTMQLGAAMFKFARKSHRTAKDEKAKDLARRQFKAAHDVFDSCSEAQWSPSGAVGAIKACRCLVLASIGKLESVERRVAEMEVPMVGDEAYGHYWLLRAEIAERKGETAAAMDAVVKSVAFQNKDVETFPDALLLSADCYWKLGNAYRARDVYFEIAKLFPKTDWAEDAADRLAKVMASGKTRAEERKSTENIFFGLTEDMNELADEYLEAREAAKPYTLGGKNGKE